MKNLRKLLVSLLCVVILASAGAAASASGISVRLNDTPLVFDQQPVLQNGRVLVPLRVIFESLGASVNYDEQTKTITAVRGSVTVTLQVGSSVLYRNGQHVYLDVPAQVIGGRTLVPTRAVAESFGAVVGYIQSSQTVTIQDVPVTSVVPALREMTVDRSSSVRLSASVFPANATDKTLSYRTDNPGVVAVSGDGTVSAVGAGTATVTMTASNGVEATCVITVVVPVSSVSVQAGRARYKTNETAYYTVTVYPEDATDKSYTIDISGAGGSPAGSGGAVFRSGGTGTITATASNGVSGSGSIEIIDLDEFAAEVVRLVNIERANQGRTALSGGNAMLNSAAMIRAEELITLNSHTRPDGSRWSTVFDEVGLMRVSAAGENIYGGPGNPAAAVEGWMNSSGHRENILKSAYGQLGAGVAMDSSGRLYWVQLFIS